MRCISFPKAQTPPTLSRLQPNVQPRVFPKDIEVACELLAAHTCQNYLTPIAQAYLISESMFCVLSILSQTSLKKEEEIISNNYILHPLVRSRAI